MANTYETLGRLDEGLRLRQDVYSGTLKLLGEEHRDTLLEANNYAATLIKLKHFEEANSLLRGVMPVARCVLGEDDQITLKMRWNYAGALCKDDGATLDDLREGVTTLEDAGRISRRVLGGAPSLTAGIDTVLRNARVVLRARETPHG